MSGTLLIVDDEEEMGASLAEIFSAEGFQVFCTADPSETFTLLLENQIDLVLMDVRMPQTGGIDLLQQLRKRWTDLPIIMISGYASVDTIVRSMKYGAVNFYEKPLNIRALLEEIRPWLTAPAAKTVHDKFAVVSENPAMKEILRMVKTAAPTLAPVVITGESGTGKERIAAVLHEFSGRRKGPFVKLNCAAIPDTLLESELFGHKAGAFTDAQLARKGKFEAADGGTIFLDEIGDMSLKTQAKLLRVLQEKEFERLGENRLIRANVRVVAATNKDLKSLIAQGVFREDLYYRISVIVIHMPPLRERLEDLTPLIQLFLKEYNQRYHKKIKGIDYQAKTAFWAHNWPGNIRELRNVLERAVIFCQKDCLGLDDLSWPYRELISLTERDDSSEEEKPYALDQIVNTLTRQAIVDALRQAKGLKQQAAEILGIHRKTLYNRMKKYKLL